MLAGGGIAAVEALLALRAAHRSAELDVAMIAPNDQLVYRPLTVLEPFGPAPPLRHSLAGICADRDARLVRDRLAAVDGEAREAVTAGGERIPYDALIVATGARRRAPLERAHTFLAEDDADGMQWIVRELEEGVARSVAFVAPTGCGWSLPLYELALLTSHHARAKQLDGVTLTLVTSERAPLEIVEGDASTTVARLLGLAGVRVVAGREALAYDGRTVTLEPPDEGPLVADRVVALPRLTGPAIPGLPSDEHGFTQIDDHCRVPGLPGVYAVGDATTTPVKQGGIATQQADLAAALIARQAGPDASERVRLRAVLYTGQWPVYLQALIEDDRCVASSASYEPPWSPPQKIAARYLTPYLAARGER